MTKGIKIAPDVEQRIIDLYSQYNTCAKVSSIIGCSPESVRNVLIRNGIARTKPKIQKDPVFISKCRSKYCSALIVVLVILGYSHNDIASIAHCPYVSVSEIFSRKMGESIKDYRYRTTGRYKPGMPTKEELKTLYLDHGMTQKEVADKYGVDQGTISSLLKKYEIRPDGCNSFRYRGGQVAHFATIDDRERIFSEYVSSITAGRISYVSGYVNRSSHVVVRCNECGAHFERCADMAKGASNQFECPECLEKKKAIKMLTRKLNLIANNKPYEHTCVICGSTYMSASDTSKYCSKTCKWKARKITIKELVGYHSCSRHVARAIAYGCEYEHGIRLHKLIRRDHNTCQICGKPCDVNDRRYGTAGPLYPSIDHIIPLAKGGSHTWDNVQLAHMICNSFKRDLVGDAANGQAVAQRAS